MYGVYNNAGAEIKEVLGKEGVTLSDVVQSEYFGPALNSNNSELLDFLFLPEIVTEMLDYLLTVKYFNCSLCKKFQYTFINIFNSPKESIRNKILNSDTVTQYFTSFLQSSDINIPKVAGYFCRIVEYLIACSAGEYLNRLNKLPQFLTENISTLGYRELFKVIIKNHINSIKFSNEMIQKILNSATTINKMYFTLTVLKSILSQFISNRDKNLIYFNCFTSENVVQLLFEIATRDNQNKMLAFEALDIINMIQHNLIRDNQNSDKINEIIQQNEYKFNDIIDPIDCRNPALISIYKNRCFDYIDILLDGKVSTFVGNTITTTLKTINDEDFATAIQKYDLKNKLIHCNLTNSKINGHLTRLIQIVHERHHVINSLNDNDWIKFYTDKFLPRLQLAMSSFGGMYPEKCDSDESGELSDDLALPCDNECEYSGSGSPSNSASGSASESGSESGSCSESTDDEDNECFGNIDDDKILKEEYFRKTLQLPPAPDLPPSFSSFTTNDDENSIFRLNNSKNGIISMNYNDSPLPEAINSPNKSTLNNSSTSDSNSEAKGTGIPSFSQSTSLNRPPTPLSMTSRHDRNTPNLLQPNFPTFSTTPQSSIPSITTPSISIPSSNPQTKINNDNQESQNEPSEEQKNAKSDGNALLKVSGTSSFTTIPFAPNMEPHVQTNERRISSQRNPIQVNNFDYIANLRQTNQNENKNTNESEIPPFQVAQPMSIPMDRRRSRKRMGDSVTQSDLSLLPKVIPPPATTGPQ